MVRKEGEKEWEEIQQRHCHFRKQTSLHRFCLIPSYLDILDVLRAYIAR